MKRSQLKNIIKEVLKENKDYDIKVLKFIVKKNANSLDAFERIAEDIKNKIPGYKYFGDEEIAKFERDLKLAASKVDDWDRMKNVKLWNFIKNNLNF